MRPASRRDARIPRSCPSRGSAFAKLNRSHENFDRPSGTSANSKHKYPKHNTGDKSPAYFLVVPPGHTATALNAEMRNRDRSKFSLSSRHSCQSQRYFLENRAHAARPEWVPELGRKGQGKTVCGVRAFLAPPSGRTYWMVSQGKPWARFPWPVGPKHEAAFS
jgi:hypothetical protein